MQATSLWVTSTSGGRGVAGHQVGQLRLSVRCRHCLAKGRVDDVVDEVGTAVVDVGHDGGELVVEMDCHGTRRHQDVA